ncbi:MBL fold metallo-hydrolase [Microvirga brassicacearum]|uniref:MBL fold metallo-hydrolase n=1 Tax=Microvirga brassicacearum TaxID=2580413 RepID=A0A5N3PCJ9_9HYPH|nr:MBL fold metallo-hydrolase [Microvirga brassicacearum]KAB0267423.1 MBL fold metallo-hydrolase [Microvirga brassicacearum]
MSSDVRSLPPDGNLGGRPRVAAFFDRRTCSVQYVVSDPATGECAFIDPVLDYDEKSGSIATDSADGLLRYVSAEGLKPKWVLDTHPHADHLSAVDYLKRMTGARSGIGAKIVEVQKLWKEIYNLPEAFRIDGSQWDCLFADGDRFALGELEIEVLFCPGHTLASITYCVGNAAFIHDTLLMPDYGTARCDFPGGDAGQLWHSLQRILSLPGDTRLFTGHDYRPGGREPAWESSVIEQRTKNVHLQQAQSEHEFVELRQSRDAKLAMPKLILHALQVNIAAGRLPAPEGNGRRYLRIPLDALPGARWD